MSLFKTRTFWSSNSEEVEEYFDQNCLLVTKLNSDSDYIITGSHNGILRIYQPSCELTENNNLADYKPTDIVIEKIFSHPILQLGCGRLVSGSAKTQLAILQSRFLGVYALISKEGATEHGTQNILQLVYEHKLRRAAFNFSTGPFGGTQNRDFICVQSLDGLLTFFEQETFVFCCFLPDFLLPGPIAFVRKSDSFVTSNSNWFITSFKYKSLSEAGQNSLENDDTGKKVTSDWKYNLGEAVIDIDVITDPNKDTHILVLGERNFFCLSDNGRLKYMKRLEYSPICFTNYPLNEKVMSLVISETSNLLIYENTSLKWCAQLQILPVSVRRAFFRNINGVLVCLSEEGKIECCYLGTEPSLFVAPPLVEQQLDFEQAGLELASLNRIIKNSYSNDVKSAELALNISKPRLEASERGINNQECSISIDLLPQAAFEEVQIAISVPYPLRAEPPSVFFTNLTEKTSITSTVFLTEWDEIGSLEVGVVVSFISAVGVVRSVSRSVFLPLELVAEACQPLKDNECRITLNINQPAVSLNTLFPEYAGEHAVAFKSGGGKVVSILLAKSSQRYRIQSDSFASLSLLVEQMIHRLRAHYSNRDDFSINFNSTLPVNEALHYVNKHFDVRQNVVSLQKQLSQLSSQFRLIQKRLISKFKVKNPTPLSNLELLLQDTFEEIMKRAEELERERVNLRKSQNELSCALHVLVDLIKLMDGNNVTGLIESTFSPHIYDLDGQNWEDVMDASLCYLLRTVLAKSEKDKLRAAHTSFDEVKDVAKIEKHFTQVLERVPKGLETQLALEEEPPEEDKETVPIGSKIGVASSRLLSAKRGLLTKRHKLVDES